MASARSFLRAARSPSAVAALRARAESSSSHEARTRSAPSVAHRPSARAMAAVAWAPSAAVHASVHRPTVRRPSVIGCRSIGRHARRANGQSLLDLRGLVCRRATPAAQPKRGPGDHLRVLVCQAAFESRLLPFGAYAREGACRRSADAHIGAREMLGRDGIRIAPALGFEQREADRIGGPRSAGRAIRAANLAIGRPGVRGGGARVRHAAHAAESQNDDRCYPAGHADGGA